jgi:hypothetical protein
MKLLRSTTLVFFFAIAFISCSKNDDSSAPASESFAGIWKGELESETTGEVIFYAFDIKANGVLNQIDEKGDVVGTGIWTASNNIFTGTYNHVNKEKYSVIGTHNKSLNKFLGNWGYGNSTTNGGTWQMSKK